MLTPASELILKSIDIYKKNIWLYSKYLVLMIIPGSLMTIFNMTIGGPLLHGFFTFGLTLSMAFYLLAYLFSTLFTIWVSVNLISVINKNLTGQPALSFKQELKQNLGIIWPATLISILSFFTILGGFLLLFIPGIIFAVWFAFPLYALIIDNKQGVEALKYSKHLVAKRWWGVFWRLFLPAVAFGIVLKIALGIVNLPYNYITETEIYKLPNLFYLISGFYSLLDMLITLAFLPFTYIISNIVYQELKATPAVSPITIEETKS